MPACIFFISYFSLLEMAGMYWPICTWEGPDTGWHSEGAHPSGALSNSVTVCPGVYTCQFAFFISVYFR